MKKLLLYDDGVGDVRFMMRVSCVVQEMEEKRSGRWKISLGS